MQNSLEAFYYYHCYYKRSLFEIFAIIVILNEAIDWLYGWMFFTNCNLVKQKPSCEWCDSFEIRCLMENINKYIKLHKFIVVQKVGLILFLLSYKLRTQKMTRSLLFSFLIHSSSISYQVFPNKAKRFLKLSKSLQLYSVTTTLRALKPIFITIIVLFQKSC